MTTVARRVADMATEQLEAETCTLAARLAAATCRFLLLIGELDRRESWREWGCRSTAHWLSWQCGLDLHTAREHVRVARALDPLPQTRDALARGELSYSKVRALTRISEPEAETELIEFAKVATAAQVERTVAAYRGVVRNSDPDRARAQDDAVGVKVRHNDDGTITITATLAPEAGKKVLDAIEHARKVLARERRAKTASRADAIERLADAYLQPDAHQRPPVEIVWHTDGRVASDSRHGVFVAAETVRRLACDARIRYVRDGDITSDRGRAERTVNRALRRKLVRRDGDQCRFPGCASRHHLHAHHIVHWDDGGPTDLANLVLLCSFHHRLVHEGGWHVTGEANQPLTFTSPQAGVLVEDERRRAIRAHWRTIPFEERHVGGKAIRTAHGERLDLDLTITALCCILPPDRN